MTSPPNSQRPLLYLCLDPGIPVFGRKGCSTHVREMARAMAALGERVIVASAAPEGPAPADIPFETVRLHGEPGTWGKRAARWMGFDARLWLGARAALRGLEPLARSARPWGIYERLSLYSAAGEKLAARLRLPRVLEVNAFLSREAGERLHFPRWAWAFERGILRRAPKIAAISEVMKTELRELLQIPPERVFLSPMAINPAVFHPGVEPVNAWERLSGNEGASRASQSGGGGAAKAGQGRGAPPLMIGYVGSFNHYHRPAWLIDLAEGLERRGVSAHYVVIGGTPEKIERHRAQAVERGVAGRFHYPGALEHSELPGWMAAFSLMVVPGAAAQSSPTKIIEAAAMGVPQIVPGTAPIRALAGPVGDWAFFPPEDLDAFIQKTADALENLDVSRRLAREAAPAAAREHSWARRAADALEALRAQAPA